MKKIMINILIFCLLFIFLDFCCFLKRYNQWSIFEKQVNRGLPVFNYSIVIKPFEEVYKFVKENNFRKPVGLNYKKKSIVIFGCSYAYGYVLKDNQILSYKLSQLTKRPVYNRAYLGWGVQHMLFQLRRDDFYKEVKNPEYMIFIFFPDHIRRMYMYVFDSPDAYNDFYLRYKLKNGQLQEVKAQGNPFSGFSMVKEYNNYKTTSSVFEDCNRDKNFDLMEEIFIESKKEAEKHFPGVKFVILKYANGPNDPQGDWYINTKRWNELKEKGFIVLGVNDLTNKKLNAAEYVYKPNVDFHPNEKAWDLIAPKLVQKLNL